MSRLFKKLESYFNQNNKTYDQFSPRVKKEFEEVMKFKRNSLITALSRCDSPIEQLLALHMEDLVEGLRGSLSMIAVDGDAYFNLQEPVQVGGQNFRLDFSVYCILQGKTYKYAIECDGHDFHEKTKLQARNDRDRERKLMAAGYRVIRFTGSEIWENPISCILEIDKIINHNIGIQEAFERMHRESLEGEMKRNEQI